MPTTRFGRPKWGSTLLTIILDAFVTGTFGISYLAHKQAAS